MKKLLTYSLLLFTCSVFAQTNCKNFTFDITDSVGTTIPVEVIAHTIIYHGATKKTDTLRQFLSRDTTIDGYSLGIGCDKDTVRSQKLLIHKGTQSMVVIAIKRGFPAVNDINQPMPTITLGFKPDFTFYWDGGFDSNHNLRFRLVQGIKNK